MVSAKHAVLLCCCLGAVSAAVTAEESLFVFEPRQEGPVTIRIDAARRAQQPVNRLLYGKFTEHLARNIYHGMWAQLVRNPGFEPSELWDGRTQELGESLARQYGMPDLATWIARGLPPYWSGVGHAQFAADPQAFNSQQSLRIRVSDAVQAWSGVMQPLELPLHRVRCYQWSLHARGDRDLALTVRLRATANAAATAEATVQLPAGNWRELTGQLQFSGPTLPPGSHVLLEVGLSGPGTVWLDQCFLFPADHQDGWDADVVRMVKQSQLPILRWPGGNFASGYHWKDGMGPLHQRPTRFNRPWRMPEPNHVGTDEFMRFCTLAGCEPMICINAGNGTPQEAADWVEYCNGPVTAPMGKLRAAHGHPKPYGVRYWEIGNELYGSWQIGHCTAEEYAERYRRFLQAMRPRDPEIRFIANGHNKEWNRVLLDRCADLVERVSVHTLVGGGMPPDTDAEAVWWSLAGYPWEYRHQLEALAGQLRRAVPRGTLAITELQIFTNRPGMPNNAGLAEALFWAGIVNTAVRAGDLVEMITHSALVNHGGGLRKQAELVYANPIFLARQLYSTQPGRWPVAVRVQGPAFSRDRLHNLPAVRQAPLLDVLALTSEADDRLVLLVTNRHAHDAVSATVALENFPAADRARWQWITGRDILAANSREAPQAVAVRVAELPVPAAEFPVTFPARSVSAITLTRFGLE